MRKVLASLALGCAVVIALSAAAAACDYHHHATTASAQSADETAQAQPASTNE